MGFAQANTMYGTVSDGTLAEMDSSQVIGYSEVGPICGFFLPSPVMFTDDFGRRVSHVSRPTPAKRGNGTSEVLVRDVR
jgi:hypothetical protein